MATDEGRGPLSVAVDAGGTFTDMVLRDAAGGTRYLRADQPLQPHAQRLTDRLLHWAELQGCQLALKQALFKAYFTDGQDPSNHEVLVRVASEVGLDAAEARALLASDRYADEVREREQFYLQNGIHSVPAIIVNERHLISGGQPVEVFEQALRQIAAQS